jgi:hypothetical protein
MFYFLWGLFRVSKKGSSNLGPNLVKSTNFAPSLETSHEVCLDGEKSLNQPLCRRALDDHLDSDTDASSTISNGAMGPSAMSMQRKHQVNIYLSFCVVALALNIFSTLCYHFFPSHTPI